MKYQCESCGKVFVYAAKKTVSLSSSFSEEYKEQYPMQVETHVCPFCQSLEFDEAKEVQPEIASIKSVDIAEADEWIARGYVVLDRYAKTVTMAKREVIEK